MEQVQANAMQSRMATFVFTDLEGSTRLLRMLGQTYLELLDQHHRLIRAAVTTHGGTEIGTEGDAFFLAFDTPDAGLAAALATQRSLASSAWPVEGVRVRMGVHTGSAVVGSTGWVGLALHQAARICSAGHGGQILVSGLTHELAGPLPAGAAWHDRGEHRLKDFDRPAPLFELRHAELPVIDRPPRSLGSASADLGLHRSGRGA